MRFLATSVGFHYLAEIGYIDQEIDDWFHGRNEEFVRSLEASYERSLNFDDDDDTETYLIKLNNADLDRLLVLCRYISTES
jgi:rapamycin-insensitive companion of mTOR